MISVLGPPSDASTDEQSVEALSLFIDDCLWSKVTLRTAYKDHLDDLLHGDMGAWISRLNGHRVHASTASDAPWNDTNTEFQERALTVHDDEEGFSLSPHTRGKARFPLFECASADSSGIPFEFLVTHYGYSSALVGLESDDTFHLHAPLTNNPADHYLCGREDCADELFVSPIVDGEGLVVTCYACLYRWFELMEDEVIKLYDDWHAEQLAKQKDPETLVREAVRTERSLFERPDYKISIQ